MTWKFDESIADVFEQHAEQHIPTYLGVIQKSVDLCDILLRKNSSIIDIGCATGKTLRELRRRGFRNLHGVDSSQAMLNKIDPDIAGINVVVLTATSSGLTVMCVPAPTAKVGVDPSPVAPPVKPLPDVILAT